MFKTSHRPDGKMADMPKSTLIFRVGLIFGSIRDMYVPATPANFPSPRWENADVLALTHACTTAADTLVNYRECVLQRP